MHRRSNSCSNISVASCVMEWEQKTPSHKPTSGTSNARSRQQGPEQNRDYNISNRRRGMCWTGVTELPRHRDELEIEEDQCHRVSAAPVKSSQCCSVWLKNSLQLSTPNIDGSFPLVVFLAGALIAL